MHKLLEYVCEELEELERKADKNGKLSMQEMQYVDTLAHTKKNLMKAEEMSGDGNSMESGYSGAGYSYARGGRGGNSSRDYSGRYSGDSMSDGNSGDGSYARGRGRGSYSYGGSDFRMALEDLMQDAPNEQVKMKLQRMMSEL